MAEEETKIEAVDWTLDEDAMLDDELLGRAELLNDAEELEMLELPDEAAELDEVTIELEIEEEAVVALEEATTDEETGLELLETAGLEEASVELEG
jgi:hypothetical protein